MTEIGSTARRVGTSHVVITRSSADPISARLVVFGRRRARTDDNLAPGPWSGGLLVQRPGGSRIHSCPMLKIRGVEHVAIAVEDIDGAAAKYLEAFGLRVVEREFVESQKTETARLLVGSSALE